MNQNQIRKRLNRDRDRELVTLLAGKFEARADLASTEGNFADGARLRDTAVWLRTASLAQARAFLGAVYNEKQAHDAA